MRHRRRCWRLRLFAGPLVLLAPTRAHSQPDEIIQLPTARTSISVAPVSPGTLPPLELSDGAPASSSPWSDPGGHIIDNLPNAFADSALGGVEAEALVIGPPGRWVPRVGAQYL